ncbi:MAG: translation elongation factor Ts [Phycisphaerae bacterium]
MPEISATQVSALRGRTGLPMMDVKKALVEANGDETAAIEILRKRFADKMSSRADKEAANGRIGCHTDARGGALVELRCETDFVANNAVFQELSNQFARQVAATHAKDAAALLASKAEFAGGRAMNDLLAEAYGKLNEKMEYRRGRCVHGAAAGYVHHNGKVGAVVTMDKPDNDAGKKISMHVASRQVLLGLDRAAIDVKVSDEARAAMRAEVPAGKPANIIEKIVDGKMDKWYAERVLLEQPFALDDSKTVGQFAKESGITVTGYLRFEVGERA